MTATEGATVWHAFYNLLRLYDMKTMFGNPGSTEQPMLKNFPSDFEYILALQEASVVATADGYSQATRKPVVVSLHTSAGTGNAMGNIMTAFLNKTPLIIIAGQQTREMLIGEPLLSNRDPEMLPKPWVKWAYQPIRAKDVPAALVRAIATATMPPAGPVYLSIPLDDWDAEVTSTPVPRAVSTRIAPDPDQLSLFAARITKARNFALVLGQEVDKSLGWEAAVKFAELLHAPVYQAPLAERAVFPERHVLFKGMLPVACEPLGNKLDGFDLVLVVGAEVWRYYPYVPGPVLPPGLELLQITNDPHLAATALVGDSLLSDARLALEGLHQLLCFALDRPPSILNGTESLPVINGTKSLIATSVSIASESFAATNAPESFAETSVLIAPESFVATNPLKSLTKTSVFIAPESFAATSVLYAPESFATPSILNAPDSFAAKNAPESFPATDPAYSAQNAAISPMTAMNAFTALAQLRPENALLVQESPSNSSDLVQAWPAEQPESYFTFSSGGLGWAAPAAVGIALAQKHNRTSRPTILAIGDGSLQYSIQSFYTAVQHKVKLVYLVPVNDEYAILKEFAILAQTPNVPALDLPGLSAMAIAKSYGCPAFRAENEPELRKCFEDALKVDGPALIEFPIDRQLRPLIAKVAAKA